MDVLISEALFITNDLLNLLAEFLLAVRVLSNAVERIGHEMTSCIDTGKVEADELMDDFFYSDSTDLMGSILSLGFFY